MRDLGLLISVTQRPKTSFGGKEMYKKIFEKAAAYFEALAVYHVFSDGNKRTSVAASARFLFINGYELTVSNKEMENFALKVAVKEADLKQIKSWLKNNSQKIKHRP